MYTKNSINYTKISLLRCRKCNGVIYALKLSILMQTKSNCHKFRTGFKIIIVSARNYLWKRRKNLPIDCWRNGKCWKENCLFCVEEVVASGLEILLKKLRRNTTTN